MSSTRVLDLGFLLFPSLCRFVSLAGRIQGNMAPSNGVSLQSLRHWCIPGVGEQFRVRPNARSLNARIFSATLMRQEAYGLDDLDYTMRRPPAGQLREDSESTMLM